MGGALCRDLRAVRHREQLLARARQPCQPLADRARDRAADAAVDLVEDDGVGAALFGERDLEREDEARQFAARRDPGERREGRAGIGRNQIFGAVYPLRPPALGGQPLDERSEEHTSEEHTSELQSLMRISYAVFCLKKKTI